MRYVNWSGLVAKSRAIGYLRVLQLSPIQPLAQSQVGVGQPNLQVPPFSQGSLSHGL